MSDALSYRDAAAINCSIDTVKFADGTVQQGRDFFGLVDNDVTEATPVRTQHPPIAWRP